MESKKINIIVALAFLMVFVGVFYWKFSSKSVTSEEASTESGAPANALNISFYSSDGKKDWVEDVTKQFNAKQVEVSGRPVFVTLKHIRSGESFKKIIEGDADEKPTIWGPVSDSWMTLINQQYQAQTGGEFISDTRPTVNIAMVVAMWEPMAQALGYPGKSIGWTDIVKVATNPQGWAAYGHPEWGSFKFGHAHPDYSTSAMLSLISAAYAAAGKTSGLTVADLNSPQVVNSLAALEQRIVHYGESSSWLIEKLCTKGPGYLSAVPVYESSVIQGNLKYTNKAAKLVAVYPEEGTFWENHPAAIVQANWVSDDQKEAAKAYLDFLTSREQQEKTYKYGFRPATSGIAPVAPFDYEHGVDPNAQRKELASVPDDVFQKANELWHRVKKPATIVLLIDTSGSMGSGPMEQAKKGAINFIKKMESNDAVQVVVFASKVTPLRDSGTVGQVRESLVSSIQGLYSGGNTLLFDALKTAVEQVGVLSKSTGGGNRQYGIVCLTDGKDSGSQSTKTDVFSVLPQGEGEESIKIFTIAYGNEADEQLMKEIAGRTNAVMFKGSEADIEKIYQSIAHYF